MQTIAELRQHIQAVEQTRKITNAMHLISAARMRKLMTRLAYNTRYLARVRDAMRRILTGRESVDHPYLGELTEGVNLYIVLAGEKGMVGPYHAELLRFAGERMAALGPGRLECFGKIASDHFKKQGFPPEREHHFGPDGPSLQEARHIEQDIFRMVNAGEVRAVYLIYSLFLSASDCRPQSLRLFPLEPASLGPPRDGPELLCHPSTQRMFDLLIPQYTLCILFSALMQTYAGEHSARVNAMQSATRSADEFLKRLRQQYNLARQDAITREIIEIMSAAEAQGVDG